MLHFPIDQNLLINKTSTSTALLWPATCQFEDSNNGQIAAQYSRPLGQLQHTGTAKLPHKILKP